VIARNNIGAVQPGNSQGAEQRPAGTPFAQQQVSLCGRHCFDHE